MNVRPEWMNYVVNWAAKHKEVVGFSIQEANDRFYPGSFAIAVRFQGEYRDSFIFSALELRSYRLGAIELIKDGLERLLHGYKSQFNKPTSFKESPYS